MGQITIKDVAEYAGVSPSTVSRVINENNKISGETKRQVREAMDKLGYYPNEIARSLVKQKTKSIGLVLSRPADRALANPFFPDIIRGIASELQTHNFQLVLTTAEDYQNERNQALKLLRNGSIEGLIVMAAKVKDDLIGRLVKNNYPFVLVGRSQELNNIPRVDNDNVKSARRMTELFISRGYEDIALLTGPEDYVVTQDRQQGYRQALEQAGFDYNEKFIYRSDFTYEAGLITAKKLLKERGEIIDGVFAVDDILAMAVVRAAQNLGISVPNNLGVVGFNDAPLASLIDPALTTVSIPIVEMGREAADMVVRMINGQGSLKDYDEEILIPTEIIHRNSL